MKIGRFELDENQIVNIATLIITLIILIIIIIKVW